jgi:nicotinamide-nucleotide amidase
MAAGARLRFDATLAVAITGVAGPDGGTEAKPVGLTYLALADARGTDVRRQSFGGDRSAVREAAVREALGWLAERAAEVAA